MVVKAWLGRMRSEGEEEGPSRRWPGSILRRSGARAARRALHVQYRAVPALPLDLDDTVSCFCRYTRAARLRLLSEYRIRVARYRPI